MIVSAGQVMSYLLMLARVGGLFVEAPLFNSRSIPVFLKVGIAVWFTASIWFVSPVTDTLPFSLFDFMLRLVNEAAIGFLIGFILNILFLALQAAGEIIDMQMGLSVASALDPVFGAVISVVGRFIFMTALFIFLIFNGHHLILTALQQSFTMIPAGKLANWTSPGLITEMIELGKMLWLTAIKIAGPVVLVIFLSDFAFGIVSRVAPQVNVFMLGFQVKPSLGLLTILFTFPLFIKQISKLLETSAEKILTVLMYIK
ncbi:flagellar biosynthetic protein FliR [candidate division WOR-1 bacterium RIFOXYA12_FULL_43_27]|uniref:Flagellar biosynthetic protein FliR n=1 Tax=candidate division WOR-1 bacterium RIFOXYC2_FULL_46_14 TaxID=1802587 RepID=A0A1F4U9F6_UNCSA|nr:MAG: flagellar biosynthetic protein FliR [candidate division WOR-1 bacterium RIFOXYA12_FULL_43_27]OGC19343.1 MAG: flagellar biosynthetic protein FliR [candidate division WOR-1 bacterium RIFOXYB2_FULL_46_45]OGC30332.1 MAG: flagellar biosynthetic protein FliR [candidate division WOR-1 bacterium RIFOXYA2_FULL_46_56]OGC40933.1 MAG: flagellar biosynthetic protein FliR [candidate division WOR-1 bacterium RIFOXYC2_FULL_46_14]